MTIPAASLLAYTADIVSAHLRQRGTAPESVPTLIRAVHEALATAGRPDAAAHPVATTAKEAPSSDRQTVFPDYIVCLEDGRRLKTLKRHLSATFNLTPDQYRAKWGLPADYPMVAPNYAETRSSLARSLGLGRKPAASVPAPADIDIPLAARPAIDVAAAIDITEPDGAASEPTAEQVFANFPRQIAVEESEAAAAAATTAARRSTRTPFAQQMARSMRRSAPGRD